MGKDDNFKIVHLIDFGLSKHYMDNGAHIYKNTGKNLVGTARYASINVHKVI